MGDRPYRTTAEAAWYLGLAEGTLRNMRTSGRGPRYLKIGRHRVFYEITALDEWARSNEYGSTSEYRKAA